MANVSPPHRRFGVFDVDVQARELRKQGSRVKIQQLPFELLLILLDHPSEVVSREELRQQLWPKGVYVDFDRSLNKAMVKLREALGDSSNSPLYVETLPRVGYRFICPVDGTVGTPRTSPTRDPVAANHTPTIIENFQAAAPARELPRDDDKQITGLPVPAFKIITTIFVAAVVLMVAILYRRTPRNPASLTPLPFTALQGLEVVSQLFP